MSHPGMGLRESLPTRHAAAALGYGAGEWSCALPSLQAGCLHLDILGGKHWVAHSLGSNWALQGIHEEHLTRVRVPVVMTWGGASPLLLVLYSCFFIFFKDIFPRGKLAHKLAHCYTAWQTWENLEKHLSHVV